MLKVSILGATGYTGFELVKLMLRHPETELSLLSSESSAGEIYSSIYPALSGLCDKKLIGMELERVAAESDAVFLCLPHATGMEAAAQLHASGLKVFDLSADYRIKDAELYEKTYKVPHSQKELLQKAVYGLAEINGEDIAKAGLIAVPGCYPTSVLLPLIPLLKAGLTDKDFLIADSKSGVSGAGKKPTSTTHFCEANEDFRPYGIFAHRHKPEMDFILHQSTGAQCDITFTPHLTPLNRGMVSTIYTRSASSAEELYAVWENFYSGRKCVRIKKDIPRMSAVANSPFIDMALYRQGEKVIIVSALDNLLKGAASQAVQCFNLAYGFGEAEGLI